MTSLVPLTLLFVLVVLVRKIIRRRPPLPPGPPADPLIGHLRILPRGRSEDVFCEWAKIYGPIFHLHIPGHSIVVLNTLQAAVDLLDKRSTNYSDRPRLVLFDIMGWVSSLAFLPYGKRFHKHRRMYNNYLNRKKCESYRGHQIQEVHRLLENIKTAPHEHSEHLQRFSVSTIMQISYGHEIISNGDPYLKLAKEAGHLTDLCGQPGSTPVDFLPFLQYLPSWFPGTYYAYKARDVFHTLRMLYDIPFDGVKRQMEAGQVQPCFVSYSIEQLEAEDRYNEEEILDIKGAAAAMNAAGADTTWVTLTVFVIAMVLYPECQAKAQQEIGSVLGKGLPGFEDRESLPYIESIVQETYRYMEFFPLGIPHYSREDDTYNGMLIPKGSIMIANARAMSLDESVYPDPHIFKPERFLQKPVGNGEPLPAAHFGFGRRICPGQHIADSSVWIAIASILATFNIRKAIGDDGLEITPEVEFIYGLTSHLKPYQCIIEPRDNDLAV